MGWDAYSSAKVDYQNRKLKDNKLDKVFKDASDFVRKKTHSVDSLLRLGGLDVSNCATMLQTATSSSVYGSDWDADHVKLMNQNADWDFEVEKDNHWAYWSAKKFLEACARNNLEIKFSY